MLPTEIHQTVFFTGQKMSVIYLSAHGYVLILLASHRTALKNSRFLTHMQTV